MKTDLQKILSISGESGLFNYISQAKSGIIAENIATKARKAFSINAKVTSLADISIYTEEEECSLREVFNKMKEHLVEADAPSAKSDTKVLVAFFEEALPSYDKDRFYVSHMKKVVGWYNLLKAYANLDFVDHNEDSDTDSGVLEE